MNDFISGIITVLIILVIIFLIFREFWCWYWKINERLEKLKNIEKLLIKMVDNSFHQSHAKEAVVSESGKDTAEISELFCKNCRTELKVKEEDKKAGYIICSFCGIKNDLVKKITNKDQTSVKTARFKISKTDSDYIICQNCGQENFNIYKYCQKCGALFVG